tara:strand:- start:569 stop:1024 length:456 start_codon:yes stop_codon:yes gene_type:complete
MIIPYDTPVARFILKRVASDNFGTFGVLIEYGEPFALTVEPPWLDNKKNISCIPAGKYQCQYKRSPKHGWTYLIKDVPGRDNCVFHKGNFGFSMWSREIETATKGCIIVGEQFGRLKGFPAVLSSRAGFREFRARTDECATFSLEIVDCTE